MSDEYTEGREWTSDEDLCRGAELKINLKGSGLALNKYLIEIFSHFALPSSPEFMRSSSRMQSAISSRTDLAFDVIATEIFTIQLGVIGQERSFSVQFYLLIDGWAGKYNAVT